MTPSELLKPIPSPDLSWRVLTLINVFRLLVPLLLAVLYLALAPSPVGQMRPSVFVGTAIAYFLFGFGSIPGIKRRWPTVEIQAVVGACVDVLAISMLTYSSGGMSSGLAAVLVLPIGAASFVVGQRLAFMFAALATLSMLLQQVFVTLLGRADTG